MNGAQLLEFLVATPSVSRNERALADGFAQLEAGAASYERLARAYFAQAAKEVAHA